MKVTRHFLLLHLLLVAALASAQPAQVPAIYSNIFQDSAGNYFIRVGQEVAPEVIEDPRYTLAGARGDITGTDQGLLFDFGDQVGSGTLFYGFIPYGDSDYPLPVYFKKSADIKEGKALVQIAGNLQGRYDMVGWEKSGKGTIGYRIMTDKGLLVYDGKVSFKGTGPFEVDVTIVHGPFVNRLTHNGAVISFETNQAVKAVVEVNGQTFEGTAPATRHEIAVNGLQPGTDYDYLVKYGDNELGYALKTAPAPGARQPFTFAYASDSRNGQGGGERNIYGVNAYIMKKIASLARMKGSAFMQFSGDLINGYLTHPEEIKLQYANWQRAIEPWWHYMPVFTSMGNHEALMRVFSNGEATVSVDRFAFETESAEAVFGEMFTNFENGPASEDGARYDPNKGQTDFPSYNENVYYYTWDNVAVIVLNSNYFYAPSTTNIPLSSGGLHAYIMDQQLKWLRQTLRTLERNNGIDHVFVTQHTPFFPNGGHVKDDMWYNGNNEFRTWVNGKPLDKGIIERRDQLLDLLVNKSSKVIAILTGDEHNFALTTVTPEMERYPNDWEGKKIKLKRTIYQVNNGAAGAPYYAQEQTPWTPQVSGFTTRNALVLFDVNGGELSMRVINPDTLEEFDYKKMR